MGFARNARQAPDTSHTGGRPVAGLGVWILAERDRRLREGTKRVGLLVSPAVQEGWVQRYDLASD